MPKFVHSDVLDGAWDVLDQANIMTVCAGFPTTRTEAITTFKLADVALTPDTDFTKANGDVSGRKVTIAAKNAVPVDTSGTGDHIAVCDGTRLLYVTTMTSQVLTGGNTCNVPAWKAELLAPS